MVGLLQFDVQIRKFFKVAGAYFLCIHGAYFWIAVCSGHTVLRETVVIVKALRDIPVPDTVYNESASDGTRRLSHVHFVCAMLVLQCATPVILSSLILSLMYNTCFFSVHYGLFTREVPGEKRVLSSIRCIIDQFCLICKAVGELFLFYIVTIA